MNLAKVKISSKENESISDIRSILNVITNWMAIPLMLAFSLADFLHVPQFAVSFLFIRLTIIPVSIICKKLTQISQLSLEGIQSITSGYAITVALPINIMIYLIADPTTPYYAGLNLVAIGSLSFIPFNRKFLLITALGIYLPYLVSLSIFTKNIQQLSSAVVSIFFILGSIIICFLIRFFNSHLRDKEYESRKNLHDQVVERDSIIKQRTEESVRLNQLSAQFSPQVVQAIQTGRINLGTETRRVKISAIFIDITNSTEKVISLPQEQFNLVLSKFMDTVLSTLLKYDITIDKFQGDGILAFANDPISYGDYVPRVCHAALEIKDLINEDRLFYEKNWGSPLKLRMGISQGEASVGFYGMAKHFKSYTAIGKSMVMASRLTNIAIDDQILFDSNVALELKNQVFSFTALEPVAIKGFGTQSFDIYELNSRDAGNSLFESSSNAQMCTRCNENLLHLDTNIQGHFVLKCRICDHPGIQSA